MSVYPRIKVTRELLDGTDKALRTASRGRVESLALWSGPSTGGVQSVMTLHVPSQKALHIEGGLCVYVEASTLDELNRWLYAHGQTVLAQIHTHPADAFHSDTDDSFPIATREGSLSIVVPDFARRGIRGTGVVAYRLTSGRWIQTPGHPVGSVVEVI